ncbi:MAG: hypothetical protein FWH27_14715 [Planctomycetaceae bacterium]|nr:hypothetical protein [Planctomycetaceae bacterium]
MKTSIGTFNVLDAKVLADLIPHEPLEPVAGIQHHRLIVVLFIRENMKAVHRLAECFSQRKGIASDLIKAVLCGNKNGFRCIGGGLRFSYPFAAVNQKSRCLLPFPAVNRF